MRLILTKFTKFSLCEYSLIILVATLYTFMWGASMPERVHMHICGACLQKFCVKNSRGDALTYITRTLLLSCLMHTPLLCIPSRDHCSDIFHAPWINGYSLIHRLVIYAARISEIQIGRREMRGACGMCTIFCW